MSTFSCPTCADVGLRVDGDLPAAVARSGANGYRDGAAVGQHRDRADAVQLGGEQPLPAHRAADRPPDAALLAQEDDVGCRPASCATSRSDSTDSGPDPSSSMIVR